ncbi:hypothetical protein LIER_37221 [Lithospermum erythrorhizon]|uniref:MBD domain-containing protein n=1 Tax=Lithospermum erythrorhizon TaxID=34254 RepID=A0AAV3PIG6_LITER
MAPNDSSIPKGWWMIEETGANGKTVKCYKNETGQRFYTMEDLKHYVAYAKKNELSIYSPNYKSPKARKGKKTKKLEPKKEKAEEEKVSSSSSLKANKAKKLEPKKIKAKVEVSCSSSLKAKKAKKLEHMKKKAEVEASGSSSQNDRYASQPNSSNSVLINLWLSPSWLCYKQF